MSKGLEALKCLITDLIKFPDNSLAYAMQKDEVDTIEKELKRLEELEKAFDTLSKEDEKTKKLLSKEIEKNRALEIIKEKDVCIELLRYWWKCNYSDKDIFEKYNYMHHWKSLTQEEYELLKEVVDNG